MFHNQEFIELLHFQLNRIVNEKFVVLPACRQHDLVRLDVRVLADEGAVDEGLVLQQVVEGGEHVRLVVVPAQGVVLGPRLRGLRGLTRHDVEVEGG